jgi:methionyl-tRNA formyltransferase
MKVGFFGTPDIASSVLKRLCREHEVVFLVAPEDKKCGRNLHLRNCSAKELALCENIPVLQPGSLKDPGFTEVLKSYDAGIFVVVAYGKLIPRSVFALPPLGTINLHPSLLPLYRGAAPVEWALINGERETGVTVQMINEKLDAGDIVMQERISLDDTITAGGLYDLVMPLGEELVLKSIDLLSRGEAHLIIQDHDRATYCPKIDRQTAEIKWDKSVFEIHNLVRGLNPKPSAWTTFRDMSIKIWRTLPVKGETVALEPGELVIYHKKRLLAGTGNGVIEILEIQPENKKRMDGLAFINGYRLSENEVFR